MKKALSSNNLLHKLTFYIDAYSLRRWLDVLLGDGESKVVGSFRIKALGNETRDLLRSVAANED